MTSLYSFHAPQDAAPSPHHARNMLRSYERGLKRILAGTFGTRDMHGNVIPQQADPEFYRRQIDRWRGELGLPPVHGGG